MAGEIASFRALSREGHAAMSMRGETDRWILIQKNTFTNWVNEQLRVVGSPMIEDLQTDFCDGIRLCALIESLQEKKINRVIKKPINQHQELENVTKALNAVANDNIRLVNIGSEDIVNGNLKLILGLIWHLILRYQIGKTKFPAKKLMLAWLRAVIPECNINNFTNDWNDGVALHALLDYCRPGLCPDWRRLDRSERLENCRNAMTLAKNNFDIPLVVRPEDLSSPDLDELSGMTYISYYMKIDSPGYHATMRMIRGLLKHGAITNFTTDWADGKLLCNLVKSLGGNIPGWPSLNGSNIDVLQMGIDGARTLGVEPVLTAKEMADPEVDHIGIMAYAAYFSSFKPARSAAEKVVFSRQPRDVYVNMEASFSLRIDDSDVSPGDIRAEIKGPDSNPPVHFNWSGRNAEGVFVPKETGIHRLNVFCENSPIVGCPVSFKAMADRSKIFFSGVEKCPLGLITELKVNAEQAGQGDVQCEARAPGGRVHNIAAVYRHGNYVMNFNPSEVGVWQISVLYDGDHINGSPFQVHVYDATNVKVYGLEGGVVGTGLNFNVDSSQAGDGDVRVEIVYEGNNVPAYIHSQRVGLYKIDFTPQGAGSYTVHVYFNDNEVRGSPYTLDIVDSSRVSVHGDGLHLVPCHRTADFIIDTHGSSRGRVNVEITGPSGRTVPAEVVGGTGEQRVEYVPVEIGDHRIEVKFNDSEVEGSPFLAKAYDASAITVTPISDTMVGHDVDFKIDVTRAGEGQLEIMVNNGNLPNNVEMERTGVYKISFVPIAAGTQTVDINFNKESIPESPLTCMAVDAAGVSIQGLATVVAANRLAAFTMVTESSGVSDARADVVIYNPHGSTVESHLFSQVDGSYKVEWTPRIAGRHRVEIMFAGREIDGSPFYIDVIDLGAIHLDNFRQGGVGEAAGFDVDFDVTNMLDYSVKIMAPSGRYVDHTANRGNDYGQPKKEIAYIPDESGPHEIYITYAGFELPGCPFIQNIDEGGLPMATGDGLYRGEEDKSAVFFVDVGNRKGDLNVQVDGPNSIAKCSIDPSDTRYGVTYIPVEVGIFTITIKWNGREIPGSPFHPKVVDPRKVRVQGGWQQFMDANERVHLIVGEEKRLPFDISQAGPGKLRAEVVGPSASIPVTIDDHTMGQSVVCFTPEEEGNHYIHLFWADLALPNSPFLGYAIHGVMDANKVVLMGRGLKEATVREEAEFIIDGSQAGPGTPEVTLTGVRAEISVQVFPLGNGKFRCVYIPVVPGAYLLHITWNGRQLRGSPYKVNIIGAFYPNKVVVSGEGLKGCLYGRHMDIGIDTRKAGPGELTASCMGPGTAAYCELEDHHDGTFYLRIKPQEIGRHVLQIKYGGEHVNGSPFAVKVGAQPDAGKVRVTGPGVEHGILANFQSRFIVETRGAGAGQLSVRIRGPKGAFQVEMFRESQKDRTILCRFDPVETGLYIIHVKWSGVDVPGSPFHVHIVDSQQELQQVLHEQSFGSSGVTPRSYAQWREEI